MSTPRSGISAAKRYGFAVATAILVLLAFALNSAFFQSVLLDGYQVSEISRYRISARETGGVIEDLLNDDRRRMTVDEVRQALERQRQAVYIDRQRLENPGWAPGMRPGKDIVDLSIILTSGDILVSTLDESVVEDMPRELVEQLQAIADGTPAAVQELVQTNESYFLPQLIYDRQGRWIGAVVLHFHKQGLRRALDSELDRHLLATLIVGALAALGALAVNLAVPGGWRAAGKKKYLSNFLTLTLVGLGFALLINTSVFLGQYLGAAQKNAEYAAQQISSAVVAPSYLGTAAGERPRWRSDPREFGGLFDNFAGITLADRQGTPFFRYRNAFERESGVHGLLQDLLIGPLSEKRFWVTRQASSRDAETDWDGILVIQISRADILNRILSLLINGFTILLISLLVMVEVLLVFLHLLNRRAPAQAGIARYELGFVRPAMFIFLLGIDLSMAFVPLHIGALEGDVFGLSQDIVSGLPISAEFFCVGLFFVLAGIWVDRRGWHEPFFTGLLIVVLGTLWSWVATDALQFILSRALVGTGYGLTLMAAKGFAITLSGDNQRASALSSLFAGLYSGSICGAAAGALLAERFGYEKVFLAGAVLVLGLIAFAWKFMGSAIDRRPSEPAEAAEPEGKVKLGVVLRFLGNPVFLALSLLSSLPASIAVAGFLHYFTPVFLDDIGARDSTIGQVLLLYGICLIYFGPPIGRFIDRSARKKYFVLAGGVLGGLAFATFDTSLGIASVIIAVFLLGISSSLVLSSQSTMVLELEATRQLGVGKAIGFFRSISRIGQVIGPMVFGWVLLSGDLTAVINALGISYIAAMLILALFLRGPAEDVKSERVAL